ncbi:MAG TPA: F0F1 ATP synthase subunit A [Vicinamibacterales bacterium]|jgi:F-type H+-transporting ATPase subunit a|nr:F0F1 ATP synthase subunit A [Vicinamibacterales bacterium]
MQEHPLWIVEAVNAVLGKPVAALLGALGFHVEGPDVIPPHIVMTMLIVAVITVVCLIMKSRLSVDRPGKFQILLEDGVLAVRGLLREWIGPEGDQYLPLIATFGLFILLANYSGLVPGLVAPTSNINVTVGCAITTWVFYHFQGLRKQGVVNYLKHFAVPPGAPVWMAPLMLVIEVISHTSRLLSLSLRLFGNIFGEELVIVILGSIIPFIVPLPMMFLGLITGGLQAFIFVLLSIIYLQAAVAVEHEHDEHGHDAPAGHHAPAAA